MGVLGGLILKPSGNPIDIGLVAFYPFNGNANDESGNGHNGSLVNAPSLVNGVDGSPNSAFDFNGSNQRIDISSKIEIDITADYSISLWQKLSGTAGAFSSQLSISDSDANLQYYMFATDNNIYDKVTFGHASDKFRAEGYDYADLEDVWRHIVVVKNGSGPVVYIDNVSIILNTTGALGAGSNTKSTIAATNQNNQFFKGTLDQIRFYQRALTTDEITFLFDNTL